MKGSTLIGAGLGLALGAGVSLFFTYQGRRDAESQKAREQQDRLKEARCRAYVESDEYASRWPGGPHGDFIRY